MNSNPLATRQPNSATQTRRYRTIIFNDDHTPMDVVVMVLMRATGCDAEEAYIEMWEAHTFGKADVHFDSLAECERVASIIGSVGVIAEVQLEWDD